MKVSLGKPGSRKMYNTATATKLASFIGGVGDRRVVEDLYQSPRGDFFLHGRGGILTKWAGRERLEEISGAAMEHWKAKAK